ncbi:MAG TPA: polyprenyl synthetase family protein [Chloroflexota bacterium]|jgi:geranylgeranyl diphosphate synthase type I
MTAQLRLVPSYVRSIIETSANTPEFTSFLLELLAQPGRALAGQTAAWPRLVFETARALGGDPEAALVAAAAVDLAASAIDVVDELIDDDWQGTPANRVRAQNAALALSFAAQSCVTNLVPIVGAERAARIGQLLAHGSSACCDGQDLDLRLESTSDVTEDLAHDMTARKSGSLVAMACRVGAAVATSDPRVIDAAGAFGTQFGLVAQLRNDLAGVSTDPARRKGDLRRHKKTLPVAFALRCAAEDGDDQVSAWYAPSARHTAEQEQALALRFLELGAHQFTWAVADVHRRTAHAALATLAELSGRTEVTRLKRLMPSLGQRELRAA